MNAAKPESGNCRHCGAEKTPAGICPDCLEYQMAATALADRERAISTMASLAWGFIVVFALIWFIRLPMALARHGTLVVAVGIGISLAVIMAVSLLLWLKVRSMRRQIKSELDALASERGKRKAEHKLAGQKAVGMPAPTIDCLVFSDTHGSMQAVESLERHLKDGPPDLILLAGDFSSDGQHYEPFLERIRRTGVPCAFVSGNHESSELCAAVAAEFGFRLLDYRSAAMRGVHLVGLGGTDMFVRGRRHRIDTFAERFASERPEGFTVLLTHEPPSIWTRGIEDVGSFEVTRFLQRVPADLVVTGHYHAAAPERREGPKHVPILNPGPMGMRLRLDLVQRRLLETDQQA